MSTTVKHILLAGLFGIIALVLMAISNLVPAAWQPVLAFAVTYFSHYYLENAPAGSPTLNPSAPATGPPATTSTTSTPANT
jgi:hypothetical protein